MIKIDLSSGFIACHELNNSVWEHIAIYRQRNLKVNFTLTPFAYVMIRMGDLSADVVKVFQSLEHTVDSADNAQATTIETIWKFDLAEVLDQFHSLRFRQSSGIRFDPLQIFLKPYDSLFQAGLWDVS